MASIRRIALVTAVFHALLAACVSLHARSTDRDAGRWLLATLCFGLFGVAGYLRSR
ncbi:hypothetical protein ACNS7O_05320 [Haloferacaceae archaeon DSL9]